MSIQLPTQAWRERKNDETAQLQSGKISAEDCYMDELFPDEFIGQTEVVLLAFLDELDQAKSSPADLSMVSAAIKNAVLKLNKINDDFDGSVIETGEREELCLFIDEAIESKGYNIEQLAQSMDCNRFELTDAWRDW